MDKLITGLKSKRALFLILAILALAGGFFRLYQLGWAPYWMDEGYTINAVISISEKGSSVLDSGESYSCPVYCYPTAFLAQTFGANAVSYRLLSAMAGIIFILMLYLVATRLFSRNIALAAASFTAFSYWQIAWSRQARWYTLFEVFFWLSLYFFHQTLYSKDRRLLWACLTAVSTVLAIYTHGLGYVLPFLFIAWFIIDRVFESRGMLWKDWKITLLTIATVLVATGVVIWKFSPNLSYELPYYLSFCVRNYWLFLIPLIVALFHKNNAKKKECWLLISAFLAFLIPLSFLTDIVQYRYLFPVTPVFYILGAFGFGLILKDMKNIKLKAASIIAIVVLFFASGAGVIYPYKQYFLESDDLGKIGSLIGLRPYYADTPQPDWNAAYGYMLAHRQPGDVIISSMPQFTKIFLNEPGYWIRYDYLGMDGDAQYVKNGREYYVGAQVIDGLADLRKIVSSSHGYIIFDSMAADGRIDRDILAYIEHTSTLVFHEETDPYSEVWVYEF